jgi:hypothetical protein
MTQLFHFEPEPDAPIVCDFTDAPDTPDERLAEYGRLFKTALVSRERTTDSTILTFNAGEGVAAWVADLAAREAACCPFMHYDITSDDTEIRWVTSGTHEMQPILDDYYTMYEEIVSLSTSQLMGRLAARGVEARIQDGWWKPDAVPPNSDALDEASA